MENERPGINASKSYEFMQAVKKAQKGDKKSMEEIIELFTGDIEYLSKFIMLPREDAIQTLKIELINIIQNQL